MESESAPARRGWVNYLGLLLVTVAAGVVALALLAPETARALGYPTARPAFPLALAVVAIIGKLVWQMTPLPRGISEGALALVAKERLTLRERLESMPGRERIRLYHDKVEQAMAEAQEGSPLRLFSMEAAPHDPGRRQLFWVGLLEMGAAVVGVALWPVLWLPALFPLASGLGAVLTARRGLHDFLLGPAQECELGPELLTRVGQVHWLYSHGQGLCSVHQEGVLLVADRLQSNDPFHHLSQYQQFFQACLPWQTIAGGEHKRNPWRTRVAIDYLNANGDTGRLHFAIAPGDQAFLAVLDERLTQWQARRKQAPEGGGGNEAG